MKPTTKTDDSKLSTLEQRIADLENLHPELNPKPISLRMIIFKWVLFCIIVGVFLYAIYVFYLYDKLGKDIYVPFLGFLRH
jgi:hypothetical protein